MFMTQPKIFISSTVLDLSNERTSAYNAVNKAVNKSKGAAWFFGQKDCKFI
jgi:hypothetical protein